ncbi:efflux RND transporter periplasmic adaptor subunit [Alkalimonas mucilaginosa]|uniref:Efflux RND transporter periplasmic adaptor subunit n=1 Tax=Alkalimonas mucilaginosa TaxID=3057676 RepID=A0ABU7JGY5_9GAMM|nr:efflux RND transporter periplasmic adaptor subunit [Alkalimonas sp. MEB004]MEE2024942.1 efflux RND transporter periplasmic adaptor subunit [Alkalimonas sp. MEB004]
MIIRTKHWFLCLLAAAVMLALLLALRPAAVQVSISEIQSGYFAETLADEGKTRLRDTYTISAPIDGYLHRVEFEPGDAVQAGQPLLTLEPAPTPALDARSLEQAREQLSAAKARLLAAEASFDSSEQERRYAEQEYQRHQGLQQQGVISATQLERLRHEWQRAQAGERMARAAMDVARYEVENARALLAITDGSRSGDERVLQVLAPVSGLVLQRHRCCEGVIMAGVPVLTLGDLHQLEVQVDLLSADAVRVRPGMTVHLERWGGDSTLQGLVRRVEPAGFTRVSALGVDEQRVPVLVSIESNPELWQQLGEGYRVEARFVLWQGDDVLSLPTSALFREQRNDAGQTNEQPGWAVFVAKNGKAELRFVEIGRRSGLVTQLESGLTAGELVITHPPTSLQSGDRIQYSRSH